MLASTCLDRAERTLSPMEIAFGDLRAFAVKYLVMVLRMSRLIFKQVKVFGSIVRSDLVDVVNHLFFGQIPTQNGLSNVPMSQYLSIQPRVGMIRNTNRYSRLRGFSRPPGVSLCRIRLMETVRTAILTSTFRNQARPILHGHPTNAARDHYEVSTSQPLASCRTVLARPSPDISRKHFERVAALLTEFINHLRLAYSVSSPLAIRC